MKEQEIRAILKSFFISEKDLLRREVFKEFTPSMSSLIIDDFAQNYLLNNPHLSIYLSHTDGSMLLKKMKDFIAFLLSAPIDREYVERIQAIGAIHYSIKISTAKVSYGFWAINEVLYKLAEVNSLIKEHRRVISKIFRFVEQVMNDAQKAVERSKNGLVAQSSNSSAHYALYLGFNMHKQSMKKLLFALKSRDMQTINAIEEEPLLCSFGRSINALSHNPKEYYILGIDAKKISTLHQEWHREFKALKGALLKNGSHSIEMHKERLKSISSTLEKLLDSSFAESLKDGHLALNSGMVAMKKVTENFYTKNYQEHTSQGLEEMIKDSLFNIIGTELSWAIKSINIEQHRLKEKSDIEKIIRYNSKNLYIYIYLKELHNNQYLHEMLLLLLEVLDLHLSVQERELSLITFADKAESANKAKDMFLANMSHELRTPLNAITGFSQILMMKKDTPDKVKNYLEKINIAGNNLLDLVNTILDFAKLEAGKMQFSPSLSNISDLLREVKTLISPLAQQKRITLKMPNIISLNLYIDKVLFKQVLINLLTNAVKFTPEGGLIELSILYDSDKRLYRFEIKDNGIGLSKEAVETLFQAFSQVNNIYQKEQKGTGLGLMICKKIIEDLHKGKIWVQSVEGEGSSFFITMSTPMIESHTYSIHKAKESAPSVLIVEDSESYQKILIEHLKMTHNLTITDTINKAKDLLSKNSYSFIILDFFLTDGISSEVLHFMEDENISTPAIVISAEDEIDISSSLAGSSNLEVILNKNNIDEICASLRGEVYQP